MSGAPIELVALRAVGIGSTIKATLARQGGATPAIKPPATEFGTRQILLSREAPAQAVKVVAWDDLSAGQSITGPALVDCSDTTLWLPVGCTATLDPLHNLVIEVK